MFQKPNAFFRRDAFRRGGFSLLEVAIALVIFVIGALAIIRIFPGALNVVQGSGNRNIAVNLNRGTLADFVQKAGSVPRGTFQSDLNDGVWSDAGAVSVAGTPRRNYSLPRTDVSDISGSALGKFRYVFEEGQTIQGASDNMFVLTNHAIRPNSNVIVSEEDVVEGVEINNLGVLDFSNSRFRGADISPSNGGATPVAPFVDNSLDSGLLSPTNNVDYYVTYRRVVNPATPTTRNRVEVIQDEFVRDTSTWSLNPQVLQPTNVIPGSVEVRYKRRIPQAATPITPGSSGALNPTISDALVGRVRIIQSVTVTFPSYLTTKGRQIQVGDDIRVSYVCDAWNWLMNDEVAVQETETVGTSSAVLPVKFIDSDSATFYSTPVSGIGAAYGFRQHYTSTNAYVTQDANYAEDGAANGFFRNAPSGLTRDLRSAFNAGRVFVSTLPAGSTSAALRVSYRTRDAWAHQVSVAPWTYTRSFNGSASAQPWRDFYVGSDNYLYFQPSEAGKTISISYRYGDVAAAATTDTEVVAQIATIDEDIIDKPSTSVIPTTATMFGSKVARAQLIGSNGNPIPFPVTAITSIEGLSVQIRTAWLEGSRFTQSSLTGYRQEDAQ